MKQANLAEYIWLDGNDPTQQLRSKTRAVPFPEIASVDEFPAWSFDGSSTLQADGGDSDCLLRPVRVCRDPLRGPDDYLVLCEVDDAEGNPHVSNHRARLRAVMGALDPAADPWVGFEQEYTLLDGMRPLGFPEHGYPAPQGPYYCAAGTSNVFGRELAEAHMRACLDAGLMLYGGNAEVMPGQWEFQVGFRGFENESGDALTVCDHVWLGRYLLHRLSESHGITVSFDSKPVSGDWNGAGMHTNFSTSATRDPHSGIAAIEEAVAALGERHELHIANYGEGLHERLTGLHETCDIATFRAGVADRGASIRIPRPVAIKGSGYLEDRRPGANADPYRVAALLIDTVCNPAGLQLVARAAGF